METSVSQQRGTSSSIALSLHESSGELKDNLDPKGWVITASSIAPDKKALLTITLADKQTGRPLAVAQVAQAETSAFQQLTQLPSKNLVQSLFLESAWVSPTASHNVLPAILYLAGRRGRIWGRQNLVTLVPDLNSPILDILKLQPMDKVGTLKTGQTAVAQVLDYALHHAFLHCQKEDTTVLIQDYLADEVIETVETWLDHRFFKGSWAQAIAQGTLTREQYLACLRSMHHYVRYTTRLLGRAVALSNDPVLRDHYLEHLRGEVNHERIIERDLKHLGGDVDYMMGPSVPNIATKEFMVVQESTIAFYQDVIVFLACPLAAEGISSHITPEFMEGLYKTIASWGVAQPKEAARFLASHTNTDGGDDGHWQNVVNMLRRYLRSENELQRFLSILHGAMNGLERSFNSSVDDYKLWEAIPERRT